MILGTGSQTGGQMGSQTGEQTGQTGNRTDGRTENLKDMNRKETFCMKMILRISFSLFDSK